MPKLDLKLVEEMGLKKLDSPDAVRRKNNSYALNEGGRLSAVSFSEQEVIELSLEEEAVDLEHLYLANNDVLATLTFKNALPKLKLLYLNKCWLSSLSLPAGFSQLQQIYLQNNSLQNLELLGEFPALKLLDASNNQLHELNIGVQLPNLAHLYLQSNTLQQLNFTTSLPILETLDVRKNLLEALPEQLLNLTRLNTLYLYGNPLSKLPQQIISDGERDNSWTAVKAYLTEFAKKNNVVNDRAKLIIVGNGRVGKTCLFRRLKGEACRQDEPFTHGIQIGQLNKFDLPEVKTETLNLSVWDFGGQEIFYATHQFFLSEEAIYILAWTNEKNVIPHRERDKAILPFDEKWRSREYWLESIRLHGQNSPILMVQTHSDCKENKLLADPSHADKPYHAQHLDFSATKDYGLLELRDFIQEKLQAEIPFFGQLFPASYRAVIEAVENNPTETSISMARFYTICTQAGISPGGEKAVLDYLNKSGVVVYFDKPLLNDTIFTNPNWLTKQVYTLINNQLRAEEGRIDHTYIQKVLPDFSELERTRFLELLKNFELVFEEEPQQYIAPQYLPKELTGVAKTLFNGMAKGLELAFVFRFPRFMPDNVMVNFLCRYGPYSDKVYWKNGIQFYKNDQACIVECAETEDTLRVFTPKHLNCEVLQHEICAAFVELSKGSSAEISLDGEVFVSWQQLQQYQEAFEQNPEQQLLATDGKTMLWCRDFAKFLGLHGEMRKTGMDLKMKSSLPMDLLQKELAGLTRNLELMIEKRDHLERAWVLAYDEEKKFALKKQLEQLTTDIAQYKTKTQGLQSDTRENIGEAAEKINFEKFLNFADQLSEDLKRLEQKMDRGFTAVLEQLSAQDQQLLQLLDTSEAHKRELAQLFIQLNQEGVPDDQIQILLQQVNDLIADHMLDIPQQVAQTWKALNAKSAEYTDVKGKLKLKIPLLLGLMEYEKELNWDLRKMANQIWSDLKSGKIFLK